MFSAEEFESELKRLLEKINSLIGSEFHEKNRERIQQEASQLRKRVKKLGCLDDETGLIPISKRRWHVIWWQPVTLAKQS